MSFEMSIALSCKFCFAVGLMLVDSGSSSSNTNRQSLEFWRNTDAFCGAANICREEFPTERIRVEENIGNGKASAVEVCTIFMFTGHFIILIRSLGQN